MTVDLAEKSGNREIVILFPPEAGVIRSVKKRRWCSPDGDSL